MREPSDPGEADFASRPFPGRIVHGGRSASLEPLATSHAGELFAAAAGAGPTWTHLRYGPCPTVDAMRDHVSALAGRADQPFWAVRPTVSGTADGWLSLCDVYPADAAIEIGSIWFSPRLQRTRAATEAIFLLMRHAFDDLGYLRLVWRCDAANAASRRAAERLGFVPEGVWRRGVIIRGEQRDVAWYAMLADEWPGHRAALRAWLDDGNFAPDGMARASLAEIRKASAPV